MGVEISGGAGAGSTLGNVNIKAGTVDVDGKVVEMVSAGNFDITGVTTTIASTTTTIAATTMTLSGTKIEVEDKANNKKYDLIKFLAGNRRSLEDTHRRLQAIEEKAKDDEDDDSPTTTAERSNSRALADLADDAKALRPTDEGQQGCRC